MSDVSDGLVIRMDPRTRTTITVYMAAVTGLMVFLALLSLTGVVHNPNPPSSLAGIALAAIAGFGILVFILDRSRVVLYPDGIEVTRLLWPSRRVARVDIISRRMHPAGWRSTAYHIVLTSDGHEVSLPSHLEHNPVFDAWLKTIPLQSRIRRR
jgi:hypothetical protein